MADIRIKDLATTAASTASDDFLAVDGSANGTRKLNAYSPTFGGNLTVSGTGNLGGGTAYTTGLTVKPASDNYQLTLLQSNANSAGWGMFADTSGNLKVSRYAASAYGTAALTFDLNGAATFQSSTTTTVGGNLTVSGDATFAGYVLNRVNAKGIYTGTSDNCGFTWTGTNGEFSTASGSLILKSAGTTALTLDSSQNATFAGTGTSSFAGNLNIKGALGAHQTAALNLAYEGSSVSQLVAYGADASTLGRVNVILRKAGTGTDAVTGLSVRDFGIITQGGVAQTPASASATGTAGTIQWDASYIYVCTATNTWKRVAIATW